MDKNVRIKVVNWFLFSLLSLVTAWFLLQSAEASAMASRWEEENYESEDDWEEDTEPAPRVLPKASIPTPPLNIVFIMTDDQRWDTLWAMPIVQENLIGEGVHFTNAFVSTPLCCPDRASCLSGGFYAHNTGVLNNQPPNGGALKFMDTDTLATRLQMAGYKTALIGKYLNGYDGLWPEPNTPYIPPGWTKFVMANDYTGGRAAVGSSSFTESSTGIIVPYDQYLLDFLKDQTFAFLDEVGDEPFFLYFTPFAPHAPAIPAPGDETLFERYIYRGRSYGEEDLSDKPAWVRKHAGKYGEKGDPDEFHRDQLRSLQAVDRTVGAIVEKLKELGKLERTLIVFTSDNGFMWGEHGLSTKNKPYEESIRVPLVVVIPGIPAREDRHRVVVNLDIPATIFELAGKPRDDTDGVSLIPLLKDPDIECWRGKDALLIEGFNESGLIWAGLRGARFKYVEYSSGEKELYDLKKDTYELENLANKPEYQNLIDRLALRLNSLKGLAIIAEDVPIGLVGKPYNFEVKVWGGKPPYSWSVVEGSLPQGLRLDSSTGVISGIPVEVTKKKGASVSIKVEDSSIAKHTGKPQAYAEKFRIKIVPSEKSVTAAGIETAQLEAEVEYED